MVGPSRIKWSKSFNLNPHSDVPEPNGQRESGVNETKTVPEPNGPVDVVVPAEQERTILSASILVDIDSEKNRSSVDLQRTYHHYPFLRALSLHCYGWAEYVDV